MEIVVRTPHGDADVSVSDGSVSVSALVAEVTGQAVPSLVDIDGRLVDASVSLVEAGAVRGSVLSSLADRARDDSGVVPVVDIVETAGPATGRVRSLAPGRYHLGPSRRAEVTELEDSTVDHAVVELTVHDDAHVVVRPHRVITDGLDGSGASDDAGAPMLHPSAAGDTTVALDGTLINADRPWTVESLRVGSRAFQRQAHRPDRQLPPPTTPQPDGSIPFTRTPRRPDIEQRAPILEALEDARSRGAGLWRRRPEDLDAFVIPWGYRSDTELLDDRAVVTLNLLTERGAAIGGTDHFRLGVARAIVVELCTLHGPADVRLIVATHPDRAPLWDWAKWLPHVRAPGGPRVLTDETDVGEWALGVLDRPTTAADVGPLTVVVVDNEDLWIRRDSPLRHVLSSPPPDVRMIVATEHVSRIPAVSTATISQETGGRARFESFTSGTSRPEVIATMIDVDLASDVARWLSALDDLDLDDAPAAAVPPTSTEPLLDLLSADGTIGEDVGGRRLMVTVGRRDAAPVDIDITSAREIVVRATSMSDARQSVAVVAAALTRCGPPDELAVVQIASGRDVVIGGLALLEHVAEPQLLDDRETPRLLQRVQHLLDEDDVRRVVVLIDEPRAIDHDRPGQAAGALSRRMIDQLGETRVSDRLMTIIATDDLDSARPASRSGGRTIEIRAERHVDHLRGIVRGLDDAPQRPFRWHEPPPPSRDERRVGVVPFVVGRSLTALEQRLRWRSHRDDADRALEEDLAALAGAHHWADSDGPPLADRLIPPPFDPPADLDVLLSSHPGDGVPVGVIDRPASQSGEVCWWEPGPEGSMLLLGSPRSGMDAVFSILAVGIAERFSPDDVVVLAVDSSATRRRGLGRLPHCETVASPDDEERLGIIVERVATHLAQPTGPPLLLMIHDIAQVRRAATRMRVEHRLEQVLSAATIVGAPVNVVVSAHDSEAAGALSRSLTRRLVGSITTGVDEALGAFAPLLAGAPVGRCIQLPGGDVVQLANAPRSLEQALASRLGDAGTRG